MPVRNPKFRAFLRKLKFLKKGKKFITLKLGSNHRQAISTAQVLLDRKYTARRDGRGYVVERTL